MNKKLIETELRAEVPMNDVENFQLHILTNFENLN